MEKDYIKNQFATYEIALKLKELGFDEPCLGCYYDDIVNKEKGILHIEYIDFKDSIIHTEEHSYSISCLAPLWQQVIDWFIEKYDIKFSFPYWRISDSLPKCMHDKYECVIFIDNKIINVKNNEIDSYYFDNPNSAREQAILKCIELCQKGK